jgi:hypothetical protein
MLHIRTHKCVAEGCSTIVQAIMFMCPPHWEMVPIALQNDLWKYYRPGQEKDLNLSDPYIITAFKAIAEVARREGLDKRADWYNLMAVYKELPA